MHASALCGEMTLDASPTSSGYVDRPTTVKGTVSFVQCAVSVRGGKACELTAVYTALRI